MLKGLRIICIANRLLDKEELMGINILIKILIIIFFK
jgi:hypothetical protein